MSYTSRRGFLKISAAVAAGAAALGRERLIWPRPSGLNLKFPTAPRERLAVASWPFRAFMESPTNRWARNPKLPGMDLKDFPAMVVSKFNLHGMEPLDQHFRSTDLAYVHQVREAAEKAGVRVVDIPCSVGASFYDTDPAQRKKAVGGGRKWVDVARALGSPSIRAHIQGRKGLKPDATLAAESLKELAAYGAEYNIIINLENDDNFTEDPFMIVDIMHKVASPYLHALPDFCNSMLTHDQAFNNRAMEAMFPLAYNIAHVKDSEVGDKNKVYTVDVAKCFEIARAASYRGYFSMEWEGAGEPYAGTQKLIDYSLKYLA
jgi:sugar phosphate isomerase/epimerase